MRRVSQATGGSYNKPPPGPISHGPNRIRLHTPDASGPILKDRYGSPRERSPSLGSVLPMSPSHLMNNREKSSISTSQDLHDCFMCLSAYIQSLNTVCGTACRLAQCLSQVGSENVDSHGTGNQMPNILKESAEIWEGIARVMGVSSTGVKNHMIQLMQDVQKRHNMDISDQNQSQEVSKIVKLMLSTFLNLHCQFSRIILEKFSGILQHLKDDSIAESNSFYSDGGSQTEASPNVSPNRPSPSPPNGGMQYSPFGSTNTSPHQALQHQLFVQQQQQQQLILQQQLLQMAQQQQFLHLNSKPSFNESTKDESTSRHSSGGSSLGLANFPGGWNGSPGHSQHQQSSSPKFNANHAGGNTISPGLLSTYAGINSADWSVDAISRRWSMGGEDGWQEKNNSLSPFSMMSNRRWSVPETAENDSNAGFCRIQPFYNYCNPQDVNFPLASKTSHSWSGTKSCLYPLSRENSSTRSPSHSRSITPEQKRPSIISGEELDDVIELLSLPLSPSSRKSSKSSVSSVNSFCSISPNRKNSDHSIKKVHHRISELDQESMESMKIDLLDLTSTLWHSTETDLKTSLSKSETESTDDGQTQISTPLWPPTETVPGVTLTACIGKEEGGVPNCWSGDISCGHHGDDPFCCSCSHHEDDSFNRKKASWLNASFTRLGIMDDFLLSDQPSTGPVKGGWTPTFRRHSTDAPYFLSPSQLSSCAKTRSFENITKMVDLSSAFDSKCDPNNIEGLLCLGSLNSPFSPSSSNNSHYTLFTS